MPDIGLPPRGRKDAMPYLLARMSQTLHTGYRNRKAGIECDRTVDRCLADVTSRYGRLPTWARVPQEYRPSRDRIKQEVRSKEQARKEH